MDLRLTIRAAGMVTCLGLDLSTSCAAARAGVRRLARLEHYRVRSPDDGSVGGLGACAVSLLTEGFEGDLRLVLLVSGALKDLQRSAADVNLKELKTGFYLSMPSVDRCDTGAALIAAQTGDQSAGSNSSKRADISQRNRARAFHILREGARLSDWPGAFDLRLLAVSGDPALPGLLSQAADDLAQQKLDTAIVGGVDSMLDEDTLTWMEETGRLKTPSVPAGVEPGESAAFFLVETAENARRRKAEELCQATAVNVGVEKMSQLDGQESRGEGLAATIENLLANLEPDQREPIWFILGQNGEKFRGVEWGFAELRLLSKGFKFDQSERWFPAESFGSTGAASGALSVCVALEAFRRRYNPASSAVVALTGDGTERGALMLRWGPP